jgi:hypothetical protein
MVKDAGKPVVKALSGRRQPCRLRIAGVRRRVHDAAWRVVDRTYADLPPSVPFLAARCASPAAELALAGGRSVAAFVQVLAAPPRSTYNFLYVIGVKEG